MKSIEMRRTVLKQLAAAGFAVATSGLAVAANGPRVGILMLHGKNPGSSQDPNFGALRAPLEAQEWKVLLPDMPWSRQRYLDGDWDKAMAEIAGHVAALRAGGAERIVLIGHSMGCPAAMGFAVRGGDVDALVLLAPGHVPKSYYEVPQLSAVRDSINEARELVKQGKGDSRERFTDINQGRQQNVITTAREYLSYFDPNSDADMGMTAPRIPARVPTLTAIGERDPLFAGARRYFVDKLPPHPKNRYLEVSGGHLETPRVATEQVVAWIREVTGA